MQQLKQELIALAAYASSRNWVPATSGNFSQRIDDSSFVITASGGDKGTLTEESFTILEIAENDLTKVKPKPSAETLLHSYLYRLSPEIKAVAHVHSRLSVLLSLYYPGEEILLTGYELLKALADNKSHDVRERLPIFNNTQVIDELAREVESYMREENPEIRGYLIRGHGLYTWGRNIAELRRHLEALDMILDLEWAKLGMVK